MKTKLTLFLLILIAFGSAFLAFRNLSPKEAELLIITPTPEASVVPQVTVIIDDGAQTRTFSEIKANNAYLAIQEATKKANLEVKVKQYDFGVLVEAIGDQINSSDKAWIYFVNGTAGDVAADQKQLNSGDKVEWKYIEPM